jgi:Tol biopolymer transport system component
MVPIANFASGTGELVTASSFSPDSRMIAFASTKSGSQEIWVKPVEGGEPIQVTRNGFFNQYPVWSPSGNDIAFFSNRLGNNGIWRTSFAGGEQVQMVSGISSIARLVFWSPQGKLYFQDGTELFAADEKTGAKTKVTDLDAVGIKPRIIEISDDGQKIAYSIKEGGIWKVKVSDPSGGNSADLGSSDQQIDQLSWDPGGKSVLYSGSAEGVYQIFRADIGGSKPVQLSNGNLDFFVEDVSADGTKILYSSVQETSDLWQVSSLNSTQSAIANDVPSEFWPDISPDGKSVAYQAVSQADRAYRGSVKSISLTGSNAPSTLSTEGFAPVWSPDSRTVAFFRRSDAGISIWRVQSTGGDVRKLADGLISPPGYFATPYLKVGTNHMSWSPDGQLLAYSSRSDGNASYISLVSADGAQKREIKISKEPDEDFCCPVWLQDGAHIIVASEFSRSEPPVTRAYRISQIGIESGERVTLFEADTRPRLLGIGSGGEVLIAERVDPVERTAVSKTARIVAINIKSQARRQAVTLENVYFENIHLSRDGRNLVFSARSNDLSALWTVPVAGGSPKKLIEETDPKILLSSATWSPDGRSIIFGKQTRTTLLSMLSN